MDDCIEKYLKYIVIISIITFTIISFIFVNDKVWDNISKTIPIVTILYFGYSRYIWRFNPFEKTPKLYKNYTGQFVSTYKNKKAKYDVNFKIKQTLFNINISCETKESKSCSINANIYCEYGKYKLIYNYLNEPDNIYRHKSEIHYGTCILLLDNNKNIKGKYYTDRNTMGDIKINKI